MAAAKGDAKDPAYAASERLAVLLTKCNRDAILKQLEPNALFQGLTGVVSGAGAVALHLVQFASNAGNSLVVEETYSYKDMKTASTVLRVHDLRVEDTIAINHSLLITKITRRRIASRLGATEQSKQLTRAFMRSLLEGPPMRPTTRYPVLDFSYRHIDSIRDVFFVQPRIGKRKVFTGGRLLTIDQADQLAKNSVVTTTIGADGVKVDDTEQVLIKSKGRDGSTAAYQFEKKELKDDAEEQEEEFDWGLAATSGGLRREVYEASAVKLCNNNLKSTLRLDDALKKLCFNGFYCLTWVDLSFNKLTNIPDLSQFPLIILYLHANDIRNVNEVKKLRCLESLHSLTLYGNPIQDQIAHYKYSVLNMLETERPWTLKKFDFAVLSERDRDNMKTLGDFTNGVCTRDPRDFMHLTS